MDKIYVVYGTTYDLRYIGETDLMPLKAFSTRQKAEDYAIEVAKQSLDKEKAKPENRVCEYNEDKLMAIFREDLYGTYVLIDELDVVRPEDVETHAYIIFGTVNKEDDPDHRPFKLAYADSYEASLDMLREAYRNIIKYDINNHSIAYETMEGLGQRYINKIYDGDEWFFELRVVGIDIN